MNSQQTVQDLCRFMNNSPVNFWAVENVRAALSEAGFKELSLTDPWTLCSGDRRFVRVNGTAFFAFIVGETPASPYHVVAAHSDSPGFRIKPKCEMQCEGGAVKLNTEVYGGPILYTWFDRPLSLAGRVMLKSDNPLQPQWRLVRMEKPLMTIPHLAIHFNRAVNEGNKLSKQKDMLPVAALSCENPRGLIRRAVAEALDIDPDNILDYDLSLYDTTEACIVGFDNSMISSGRLDDLSMVHAGMTAFLQSADNISESTRVLAIFDNEETGSGTKQGAGSMIFHNILKRMVFAMGGTENDFIRAVAGSFMVSADNAHGFHPNYPEKYDPTNHPVLGGGPCIKINANCKYMTDADSAAVFAEICRMADVPVQYFVNHSDSAGGSTLGNILTSSMPMRGVDMGAPVWAMHSVRETASVVDHIYTVEAFRKFYSL